MTELPNDSVALQALVLEQREMLQRQQNTIANLQGELNDKLAEIEQLKSQLAILKRQQFGRSSEKVKRTIQQVEKRLNEL